MHPAQEAEHECEWKSGPTGGRQTARPPRRLTLTTQAFSWKVHRATRERLRGTVLLNASPHQSTAGPCVVCNDLLSAAGADLHGKLCASPDREQEQQSAGGEHPPGQQCEHGRPLE